jgi:hypothetical protein
VYAAALILAVMSLILFFSAKAPIRVLQDPDVLLGFSNSVVLVIAGLLSLAVSGFVFATRALTTQAMLLLWFGMNHVVYRVGLKWMGVAGPPAVLKALSLKLDVQLVSLNRFWNGFIACLVLGSLLVLYCEWRRLKRERADEFMKHYREQREHIHPEHPVKPASGADNHA